MLALLLGLVWLLAACGSETPPPPTQPAATETARPTEPVAQSPLSSPLATAESPLPTPSPEQSSYNTNLDYAQVLFVEATQTEAGSWTFAATVRHNDEGWDHYANAWQVANPTNGQVIAERVLAHPHDNEQPFTRSQSSIEIPPDLEKVVVRAKCNIHGFGGQEVVVNLNQAQGEKFQVERAQ